jgi:ABC-type transporter MlaC component
MNVQFQLITPSVMDKIYRNITDEKKDPFEGIHAIQTTA